MAIHLPHPSAANAGLPRRSIAKAGLPRRFFLAVAIAVFAATSVSAEPQRSQGSQDPPGIVQGVVTTQNGSVPLGGVVVTLSEGQTELATAVSETDGRFRFELSRPGSFTLTVKMEGFEPAIAPARVVAGRTVDVQLDLRVAVLVDVSAPETVVPSTGTLATGDTVSSREIEQIASGGGVSSALRLLASVIEVPGGVAIKGGLPSQAGVQLGPGTFVDPATGLSQVRLPDDAIDSVTVLPNPYAVEYGRFSSGLVLIQTRRAGDRWRTRLNNLDPTLRTERGSPLHVIGVSAFSPRAEVGGPVLKDRLFLQQSAQLRYRTTEVPSRPQEEYKKATSLSSFTRVDANLTPRHLLLAAGGIFPSTTKLSTLGTFTPPEATIDSKGSVRAFSASERSLWSDTLFSETTVAVNWYRTEITPHATAPMELLPETTNGAFFNRQMRTTSSYQLVETVSGSKKARGGQHLYKGGVDLLFSRFDGSSDSQPVLVRRSNGTLSRRLDFGPRTTQAIDSVDLAVFVQDRVQPTDRWYVEFGARLDRDGVIDRLNLTPRVGAALLLNPSGNAVLRSGFGLFYERTPSAAGVFEDFESATESRFAADGRTPLGGPVHFVHRTADDLRTSRSLTWDAAYDQRLSPKWAVHVGVIDRRGSHELLLERLGGAANAELRLDSSGRSTYREAEFAVHFMGGPTLDVNASYVRSFARADLNAFTTFYDSVLWPIVGRNEYAPARADAPHRLLVRGRAMPTPAWLIVGVVDWRNGLPYSLVDEALDFVGPRNSERFPTYVRTELGLEHRFKIGKLRPWIGVRADNAFDAWLPADVQANVSSPAFGTFYNSPYRQFRIQLRFDR